MGKKIKYVSWWTATGVISIFYGGIILYAANGIGKMYGLVLFFVGAIPIMLIIKTLEERGK